MLLFLVSLKQFLAGYLWYFLLLDENKTFNKKKFLIYSESIVRTATKTACSSTNGINERVQVVCQNLLEKTLFELRQ